MYLLPLPHLMHRYLFFFFCTEEGAKSNVTLVDLISHNGQTRRPSTKLAKQIGQIRNGALHALQSISLRSEQRTSERAAARYGQHAGPSATPSQERRTPQEWSSLTCASRRQALDEIQRFDAPSTPRASSFGGTRGSKIMLAGISFGTWRMPGVARCGEIGYDLSFQPPKLNHVLATAEVVESSVVGRLLGDECVQ